MEYNSALVDKLLEKAKEAFLMAIEVYNKQIGRASCRERV